MPWQDSVRYPTSFVFFFGTDARFDGSFDLHVFQPIAEVSGPLCRYSALCKALFYLTEKIRSSIACMSE